MIEMILIGFSAFSLGVIITFLVLCRKIFKYEDDIEFNDMYIRELENSLYKQMDDTKPDFDQIMKKLEEF